MFKAMVEPMMAPIRTSVGKWTPRNILEAATADAQAKSGSARGPNHNRQHTENMNAAEVCPEGKLNLSDAVIRLLKPGMACGGRRRRQLFLRVK